jgi:hypothetical protein
MRTVALSIVLVAVGATLAGAADMPVKAPVAAVTNPWDFAFGGGLTSDYIFRGISQSAHKPSVTAYFEPRYNFNKDLQAYVGISGESIDFPNRAASEIDIYGGIRPTFDKLALDFGGWYYWYPGGQCFNIQPIFCPPTGAIPSPQNLPNGNVVKADLSFFEVYAKGTLTFNDQFSAGASVYYSPSVLNSGAHGTYVEGNAKFTFPTNMQLPLGVGAYISGAVGHWFLGTSDAFYCTLNGPATACGGLFPNGIPYKSYTTWNIGIAFTKGAFTLDLRWYDTDLNQGDCNAFTSDHTAVFNGSFTPINPGGVGSNWCRGTFVATGKFDITATTTKAADLFLLNR